jgi:small subunit ribosomal protein S16
MLAISLMRMGAKGKPFYRLVVKEKRSKRDGKYIENVGTYNPMLDPAAVELKHERIQYWISVGAQPTETVASLIKNNPEQSEEEKAAAAEARVAKAEAEKQAKIEAKRAEAEARRAEEEKAAPKKPRRKESKLKKPPLMHKANRKREKLLQPTMRRQTADRRKSDDSERVICSIEPLLEFQIYERSGRKNRQRFG